VIGSVDITFAKGNHYDPQTALEELQEEAVLPNPVHVRDMIIRAAIKPDQASS
jgi:hypothetical protein